MRNTRKCLACLLALLTLLVPCTAPAQQTEAPQAVLVPFLAFGWEDLAKDAEACRTAQPAYGQVPLFQTSAITYRLTLGQMKPQLVEGRITVDGGLVWELETVWNVLTHQLTEAGFTSASQSFTASGCRISLCFQREETLVDLQVFNTPGGSYIAFQCRLQQEV